MASNDSEVIENIFMVSNATSSAPWEMRPTLLYSIIYSFVAFPLTPKYMTLNDLKRLNDYFTLNFHYYELALRVLLADFQSILLIYCIVCLHGVTSRDVGS